MLGKRFRRGDHIINGLLFTCCCDSADCNYSFFRGPPWRIAMMMRWNGHKEKGVWCTSLQRVSPPQTIDKPTLGNATWWVQAPVPVSFVLADRCLSS